MSNTAQIQAYFAQASSLQAALRTGDRRAAGEALDELLMLWLHATDANVQRRCASLLETNGFADEMAELCRQWAL